ncbi:hypothetical protein [Saliphagus infecundisoli]|uniref:DUF8074 domain-containing protein n=1 Tax=Saliphagus infecundisoli TaxID=1849069 RepID=A0ABD5QE20_9EURY|nr:hypothetical protein [Saliphagus infecundisoli]
MRPTLSDGVMLMYNVAVLLSAGYMTVQFGIEDRVVLLGIAVVFGLFWTVYFRIAVLPRLLENADLPADEEEGSERDPGADRRS